MSTDKKEYSLQDLYKDPSEEEDEEQDSDFVPEDNEEEEEENEEFEESDEEDQDTKEKAERESAKRPLEDEKEDPQAKKARIEALWNDIKDTKKPMTNNNNNNNNNEQDVSKPLDSNNNDTPEKPKTKPKIARPKSTLSSLVSQYNIKVPKMNTLEKSKLDWKTFVEKEGIKDELTYKNKDGYVEKVEFLQRVDERRLRQLKAGQKETKKNE